MRPFRATLRRWGNSTAAVIPPEALAAHRLGPGDPIEITIRRARTPADLFGLLKEKDLDAQALSDQARQEDQE